MKASVMNPDAQKIEVEVSLKGRDRLTLVLQTAAGMIVSAELTGSGCPQFLKLLQEWRTKLSGPLADVSLPTGQSHSDLLLREALLKAKGEWKFPYDEEELCHCRAVSTAKVDAAIVSGCRTVRAIARETSAGTSCGSCRPNTEAIISYRCGLP